MHYDYIIITDLKGPRPFGEVWTDYYAEIENLRRNGREHRSGRRQHGFSAP